jgi:ferritin-like metal-binding protein YciE
MLFADAPFSSDLEKSMAAKNKSSKRAGKQSPGGEELLVLELQEINSAENQLARVLPKLMKSVESEKLREMLEQRQQQGERLLSEIEAVLDEMDESPGRKKNVAAEGLISDAREHAQEIEPGPALDAVLLAAIQKTEHYCIAAWGTARSLAEATEQASAVKSMERALKEGKQLDEELTELAEKEITPALLAGEEGESEEDDSNEEEVGDGRKPPSKKGKSSERRTST